MEKPRFRIDEEEQFDVLRKAYDKLVKYYDISVDFKGLQFEKGSNITGTILVYPANPDSKITGIKRNNLEIDCEENYCKSCSPKSLERIQENHANISITGTNYLIRYKHFHY